MKNLKIGIIGAGGIGAILAKKLVKAGYQIVIGNRKGPDAMAALLDELGDNASFGDAKTIASNDVVFLAVRWADAQQALEGVRSELKGKILVDATNPVINMGDIADLNGWTSSGLIAAYAPGAKVVKAFNTLKAQWLAETPEGNGNRVIFISGDWDDANDTVAGITGDIGFAPLKLGPLEVGGKLQQYGNALALKNLVLLS